jgi:hypothetical protein
MPQDSNPLLTQIGDYHGSQRRYSHCELQVPVNSGEMGVTIAVAVGGVHDMTARR